MLPRFLHPTAPAPTDETLPFPTAPLPRGTLAALLINGASQDDVIDGTAGDDSIFGLAGDDYIFGNVGFDDVFGGTGNDTLFGENVFGGDGDDHLTMDLGGRIAVGGAGDDTYYVQLGQFVYWDFGIEPRENANEGIDTVISFGGSVNLRVTPNVENILLSGIANSSAIGNALDNVITGNASRNTIDGGAGADRMIGNGGNDAYTVDNAGDRVVEKAGQGTDTVVAAFAYTLGTTLEHLQLSGSGAFNGTGNTADNRVFGNSGANLLSGLGGNDTLKGDLGGDTLVGGGGDDTYVQDSIYVLAGSNQWDTVTEIAGKGTDTVLASSDVGRYTYLLDANVENLVATGVSVFRLWGNALDNTMTGNANGNVLDGFAGHDTLTGGLAADQFDFSSLSAASSDTITDFAHLSDDIRVSAAGFGGGISAGGTVWLNASATPALNPILGTLAQFLYNTTTGALSFDPDGNGAAAAILFATLTSLPTLTTADIVIIA